MHEVLVWLATGLVFVSMVPVVAGMYQYILVGLSFLRTHLEHVRFELPRVAVLIPAWNEEAVIGETVERLIRLDYPADRLRIYVVDDASTDRTPRTVIEKHKRYPRRVFHLRRVAGGEGKAHTLNYGLELLWRNTWTQAVLIMDADVLYTSRSLTRMARHLADPRVGAVTAYIKEGSANPNLIQRFVGFEYITATGASRRAQNVLGFLACLSGGAQLHTRANLESIGGKIFSATLAEDTFTTFRTQLAGSIALFDPHAIVYAEEPDTLVGLWKQRLRWARGNVQITHVYRELWMNSLAHSRLGSFSMALLWFSIFLMPIFQICASVGLIGLYVLDPALAWMLFRAAWIAAGLLYVYVTCGSLVVDWESGRRTWREGVLFPGVVSLAVLATMLLPEALTPVWHALDRLTFGTLAEPALVTLYAWPSASMLLAWTAKEVEARYGQTQLGRRGAIALLLIAGYGSFLCAVTFAAYLLEWRGQALVWDKTVKTGKVAVG